MRIISGDARGRKLFAPAGEDTRPTADRIRESLFNIIGTRVFDAQVLDLFGGTGAMALEALSRGAAHAVIVDVAREAIQAIERNAQGVLKDDLPRRARIIRSDYRTAIGTLGGRIDSVAKAVSGMKVNINGKKLVGEILTDVDEGLGRRARR